VVTDQSLTRVSIIIPAYNSSRFIRATIESAIAQDFPDVDVVVVDDGSSDDTADIAGGYEGVRVICRKNGGDAAARNTGLEAIDSEFAIFLDHDDVLRASAVRTHLEAFEDGVDMVFGSNDLIDSEGRVLGQNPTRRGRFSGRDFVLGTTPSFSQCMYRLSAVHRIGGFRDKVGPAADHDLNLRLLGFEDRGYCHGEPVMSYRLHAAQQTRSPTRLYEALMSVLEEHLGPHGVMEGPDLLRAARRHWAQYFGQFIPQEVVRLTLAGRLRHALRATRVYLRGTPGTLIGSASFVARRLWRKLKNGSRGRGG
jgi:glycosyltransferase involved in cell wall biosynthesis